MKKQSFNILVAEDEAQTRFIVSALLRHQSHNVEVAGDGREAIRLFDLKPGYYDVVITDHNMPELNGLELAEYLRKNAFQGKTIVITGSLTSELTAAYRSNHIDHILQKPFMLENLSSAFDTIFEKWGAVTQA